MPVSLPARCAIALIDAYRLTLSPFFGASCRHVPTCSRYGRDCITAHGLWAGGWMTLARFWRCRPGGTSGLDFAPAAKPNNAWIMPWRYGKWRSALTDPACAWRGPAQHGESG